MRNHQGKRIKMTIVAMFKEFNKDVKRVKRMCDPLNVDDLEFIVLRMKSARLLLDEGCNIQFVSNTSIRVILPERLPRLNEEQQKLFTRLGDMLTQQRFDEIKRAFGMEYKNDREMLVILANTLKNEVFLHESQVSEKVMNEVYERVMHCLQKTN